MILSHIKFIYIELDLWGDDYVDFDPIAVMSECRCSKTTFYCAIAKFQDLGLLPDWVNYTSRKTTSIESRVRDNLQSKLGGLTEVSTPSGRIDLLTETEIIEVKNIKDWKSALGQILIYSAFYPNHKKRIHLFGENIDNLPDIELSCIPFNVSVTGELV